MIQVKRLQEVQEKIDAHDKLIKDKLSKLKIVIQDISTKIQNDEANNVAKTIIDAAKAYLDANKVLKTFYTTTQYEVTKLYLKEKQFIRSNDNDGFNQQEDKIKNYFVDNGFTESELLWKIEKARLAMIQAEIDEALNQVITIDQVWIDGGATNLQDY